MPEETASRHKLTVIMPAYNEELTIAEAVKRSLAAYLPVEKELIVVNDGSSDRTGEILEQFKDYEKVQVITHPQNRGKGSAIRTALPYATGDIVVIEDADLELNPEDFPKLIVPIINDEADVVFGSRFRGSVQGITWFSWLGNKILSWATTVLFLHRVTDEATCYKMFRTDILRSFDLKCTRFEFCPEATAKTLKGGYRYAEVPIDYNARAFSAGKKVTVGDGFHAIYTLIKFRFFN